MMMWGLMSSNVELTYQGQEPTQDSTDALLPGLTRLWGSPAQCTEQTMSGQGRSMPGVVEMDVPDGVGPSVTSQAWPDESGWGKN